MDLPCLELLSIEKRVKAILFSFVFDMGLQQHWVDLRIFFNIWVFIVIIFVSFVILIEVFVFLFFTMMNFLFQDISIKYQYRKCIWRIYQNIWQVRNNKGLFTTKIIKFVIANFLHIWDKRNKIWNTNRHKWWVWWYLRRF